MQVMTGPSGHHGRWRWNLSGSMRAIMAAKLTETQHFAGHRQITTQNCKSGNFKQL